MTSRETKADRLLARLKNNPGVAAAVVLGTIVIGISLFTDAVRSLWSVVPSSGPGIRVVEIRIIDEKRAIREFVETWLWETPNVIPEMGSFPIVDVKLLNTSEAPVYLRAIAFDIERLSARPYLFNCMTILHSWVYNILFNADKSFDRRRLDISQSIAPGEADRFAISLGHTTERAVAAEARYRFDASLYINEDEVISLGTHEIQIDGPGCGFETELGGVRHPTSR